MNITDKLERAELIRILDASGLWNTREELEESLEYRYNYDVIARDGRTIDDAIGEYYLDELGYVDRVPKHWQVYIDRQRYGRDIRLNGYNHGRAVDELDDASGRYGTDWKYFVIRWDWNR